MIGREQAYLLTKETAMQYTHEYKCWLIQHYAARLEEERQKGNDKAASFLKKELHNLKKESIYV